MNHNPKVVLVDGRKEHTKKQRCITKRFGNCEMREFIMEAWDSSNVGNAAVSEGQINGEGMQPVLTLKEVDMEGLYAEDDDNDEQQQQQVEMM